MGRGIATVCCLLIGVSLPAGYWAMAKRDDSAPAAAVAKDIRPGDTIFERIDALRVVEYPHSNLPPYLDAELRLPFPAVQYLRDPGAWIESELPEELAARLGDRAGRKLWRLSGAIRPVAGSPVRLFVGQQEAAGRDAVGGLVAGPGPAPETFLWWDETGKTLEAILPSAPAEVRVEYVADPAAVFAANERSFGPGAGSLPLARDLVRREQRRHVTRTVLFAPAGTVLELCCGTIHADELRIAIALDGNGWFRKQDRIQKSVRVSDGAVVAVDAEFGGMRQRLWSRAIAKDESDKGFLEDRVPLAAVTGKPARLFLVSEPGPDGNAAFDYLLLGDLTFQGEHRKPERPHVILIDVDTLRADGLSVYGAATATSPNVDRWARTRATVFRDALAASSWTLPSTTSILTGTHVHQHGVSDKSSATIGSAVMLQTLLKAEGYETWGLANGLWLQAPFGFDEGFDRLYSHYANKLEWSGAVEFLKSRRSDRPLFLFLHTYQVHAPYDRDLRFEPEDQPYDGPLSRIEVSDKEVLIPFEKGELQLSPRERQYVRNLYLAGIARMDETQGPILDAIAELLRDEDYMVVFTSDHGEAFFEHEMMGHGHELWNELTRVPLIIEWPRRLKETLPPGLPDTPAAHVDIVPTILDAVGLAIPEHLPGRSLLRATADEPPRIASLNPWHDSITWQGWKLVRRLEGAERSLLQLYHVAEDPSELRDLAAGQPVRARTLEVQLKQHYSRFPPLQGRGPAAGSLDPETLKALEDLGYR